MKTNLEKIEELENGLDTLEPILLSKLYSDRSYDYRISPQMQAWDKKVKTILLDIFGNNEWYERITRINAYHCNEAIRGAVYAERIDYKNSFLYWLKEVREHLNIFKNELDFAKNGDINQSVFDISNRSLFIVHGHNKECKEKVEAFIKRLKFIPIILNKKANEGQTVIEKFEKHSSEASYAIIILTGDDRAIKEESKKKLDEGNICLSDLEKRGRQNVILELGYFAGRIGRRHTCILYEDDTVIPSDLSGIIHISFSAEENWQVLLARELEAVGFQIDWREVVN